MIGIKNSNHNYENINTTAFSAANQQDNKDYSKSKTSKSGSTESSRMNTPQFTQGFGLGKQNFNRDENLRESAEDNNNVEKDQ